MTDHPVLQLVSNDQFFTLYKPLLRACGKAGRLDAAIFLTNIVDKLRYFASNDMLDEDGGFFLTHECQTDELGVSEKVLRRLKKFWTSNGVLSTKFKGAPAKEFYYIDPDALAVFLGDGGVGLGVPKRSGLGVPKRSGMYHTNNNNKDNHNKQRNVGGPKKRYRNTQPGKANRTPQERNKPLQPEPKPGSFQTNHALAQGLARVLGRKNDEVYQNGMIIAFRDHCIAKLRQRGVSKKLIYEAMYWYQENWDQPYVPEISNGFEFRDKFGKLRSAMKRQQKQGFGVRAEPGKYDTEPDYVIGG
jgi:hypothetical protein